MPSSALLHQKEGSLLFGQLGNFGGDPTTAGWEIAGSGQKRSRRRHLSTFPSNVASFYCQGIDSLSRKNFDAAGAMFRKSLDTGLKRIHPEGKGTLQRRIDELPDATGVTPAMKEWAHQIRHLGNDATHEEEPFSDDEVKALQSFTELFLTYAFTLPGMVATRKPTPEDVPPTAV